MKLYHLIIAISCILLPITILSAEETNPFRFEQSAGEIVIYLGDQALASYLYDDPITTRPYFAHVKTKQGTQVTRNHPPKADDPQDHGTYHPGIFLAFGDINGNDYWRLKAPVRHSRFIAAPDSASSGFTVENQYLDATATKTVCIETCHYQFLSQPSGYLILMKSEFTSPDDDFYFGDQEEMGLGVRMASPLREKDGNGRILNSNGKLTAKETWGQLASWVDYSGHIHDQQVGVMLMTDPGNIRPSWWHNRNYGLFAANLFGRKAMQQGAASKLPVKQGETFHLGYGVYIHEAEGLTETDLQSVYENYTKLAKE
ncbi:hypothetical protein Pla110_27290 [Polystyrenella longa]|uniref:Methane oxygenase PmoA n=1 Tax=Polystyrenella longa TaxID=2528007 RepID=A0A518CP43_9PLAN|nr:DUF6807 family protein [Polystyrenella longa]QDU80992.1 hypothetical protein Pla110_27290 [Polystyrenella longa]